jgi:hypothetical protein
MINPDQNMNLRRHENLENVFLIQNLSEICSFASRIRYTGGRVMGQNFVEPECSLTTVYHNSSPLVPSLQAVVTKP